MSKSESPLSPGDPRYVFHIGMHKTGTSAIQSVLSKNAAALLSDHGVLYPVSGRQKGGRVGRQSHFQLASAAVARYRSKCPGGEPAPLWQSIRSEVARTAASVCILSSEFFWPATESEVRQMYTELQGAPARVVIYVRNIRNMALSGYKQALKKSDESLSFDEFIRDRLWLFDYRKTVERWSDVFGAKFVDVRVFEKEKRDLLASFWMAAGLAGVECSEQNENVNLSVSDSKIQYLRYLRLKEKRSGGLSGMLAGWLQRHLANDDLVGSVLSGLAEHFFPEPILKPHHLDWLHEHTGVLQKEFLERYVPPADHRYFDY